MRHRKAIEWLWLQSRRTRRVHAFQARGTGSMISLCGNAYREDADEDDRGAGHTCRSCKRILNRAGVRT